MLQWLVPRILLPSFTWSDHVPTPLSDQGQLPPIPRAAHPYIRRLWGIVHHHIRRFSRSYCGWVGVSYNNQIAQLPFGLILKWSDGTRIEEVLTMEVARKAGIPVPRVVCYGEHPDSPHAPISILMTRVPSRELGQVYKTLTDEEKESVFLQLDQYLKAVRRAGKMGWLGMRILRISVPSRETAYEETLNRARRIEREIHRIIFIYRLGGKSYLLELDCERALTSLTSASYYWELLLGLS
ncbi:hypothetical protein BO71DRAFT_447218 [Aspergillus ellipticus CBS 707.79]|uniref:Aminoglycoside phosphotransferase domain-containing protein n=1 Tax=Aspergillus ellipticus CBS 707.79 TaxID=1448320 RepID=A0A319DW84_9EURO|nr:hypothetical protein BO71DRAFT_447218 [Aspergillus ellipticus CBS 707.79]